MAHQQCITTANTALQAASLFRLCASRNKYKYQSTLQLHLATAWQNLTNLKRQQQNLAREPAPLRPPSSCLTCTTRLPPQPSPHTTRYRHASDASRMQPSTIISDTSHQVTAGSVMPACAPLSRPIPLSAATGIFDTNGPHCGYHTTRHPTPRSRIQPHTAQHTHNPCPTRVPMGFTHQVCTRPPMTPTYPSGRQHSTQIPRHPSPAETGPLATVLPQGISHCTGCPTHAIDVPFRVHHIKQAIAHMKQTSYTKGVPIPFLKAAASAVRPDNMDGKRSQGHPSVLLHFTTTSPTGAGCAANPILRT